MTFSELPAAVAPKLSDLCTEHDDLDTAITALLSQSMHDTLLINRLKKRKLQLRDEIALMLASLDPQPVAQAS